MRCKCDKRRLLRLINIVINVLINFLLLLPLPLIFFKKDMVQRTKKKFTVKFFQFSFVLKIFFHLVFLFLKFF